MFVIQQIINGLKSGFNKSSSLSLLEAETGEENQDCVSGVRSNKRAGKSVTGVDAMVWAPFLPSHQGSEETSRVRWQVLGSRSRDEQGHPARGGRGVPTARLCLPAVPGEGSATPGRPCSRLPALPPPPAPGYGVTGTGTLGDPSPGTAPREVVPEGGPGCSGGSASGRAGSESQRPAPETFIPLLC